MAHLRKAVEIKTMKLFALKRSMRLFSTMRANPGDYMPAGRGKFFQSPFQLFNPYNSDFLLKAYLRRFMPQDILNTVTEDLERFGDRIVDEIDDIGRQCELNPPKLRTYSAWGDREDALITCQQWKCMHDISAEEGLVSIAYDNEAYREFARLFSCAKLFLFAPSSGLYSCPLAMTDGAAKLISMLPEVTAELRETKEHILSRDPEHFWTSGQWMTERGGGSDVAGGTDTYAVKQKDGGYRLYGYKWFSSAIDADVTFTLAREVSEEGDVTLGTNGLSLFFLRVRDSDGHLNGIEIHKLKDKLGTRQLPTAELLLCGSRALRVSDPGRGVASISPMLTVTRIHNAISAVGVMRRILQLSTDYCTRRSVFGDLLSSHPLHLQTLARMEVEARGCQLFVLETCRLLGLVDCGKATEEEALLLRLLTPLLKLYTGKQVVPFVSEGLESFGGQGYIEETGLPVMLRDAQVLPIWEGTTNVLSLDVLRSIQKSQNQSLEVLLGEIGNRLDTVKMPELESSVSITKKKLETFTNSSSAILSIGIEGIQMAARDFSLSLAHLYVSMLLLEHASSAVATVTDATAAKRWCSRPLPLITSDDYTTNVSKEDKDLLNL